MVGLCPGSTFPLPWDTHNLQISQVSYRSTLLQVSQQYSVQLLSCVRLFATLWTAAHQASLSITNS